MTDATSSPEAFTPQAMMAAYLSCLLEPDGRRARRLIQEGLDAGVDAAVLYLSVISPAMYEVGRLWETAEVSVAQEHLATQITQAVIASLGLYLTGAAPVGRSRVAVVASSPGELHALGGQMVADFLEAQGWRVLALGPDTPAHDLAELAQQRQAAVVALSTALPGHLLSVTRACQLLRQLPDPPFIVVGGRAYHGDAQRARGVGADGFADDPRSLLTLLAEHFGSHASH